MRAFSLFCVLALAKALSLAGQDISPDPWLPWALFWQDAFIAFAFAAVQWLTHRRPSIHHTLYWLLIIYTALNVPLVRILSSPLTWQMSRAAHGALADSITYYLSLENCVWVGLIVAAGAILPRWFQHMPARPRRAIVLAGIGLLALGPYATSQVRLMGLHRNALWALVTSALPRVSAQPGSTVDWRASRFSAPGGEDLRHLSNSASGRNVVLISLESTGAQYLGLYGADLDPMPNLRRLAREAIIFENAYAVYPESIKGLFSILLSRYPAFDVAVERYARVETPSLASVLGRAGYRSALFHSGRFIYLGMNAIVQDRGFELLEDAGAIGGNVQSSFGVDDGATVERTLQWIDSLRPGERFFITYLPISGHHPYEAPPGPFPAADEQGRYLNALHYSDVMLQRLFDGFTARGLASNTLFVIFGDHGEAFGQHSGNYGHTLFIHEENVRVPLIVVVPGMLAQPLRVSRTASLMDITPTILDLLGLDAPMDYQGSSLLKPVRKMALFYTDYSLGLLGLRDGSWKFIHEIDSGDSWLFNLDFDPNETENLASSEPERMEFYRELLQAWSRDQKARLLHESNCAGTNRKS